MKKKQEALTVTRFIHEILVSQLSIPLKQIVNDTTFSQYTGSNRPDLLISEFEYDLTKKNDNDFISNLVAYAEAKDDCSVGDANWMNAYEQGLKKAPKLNLPYFIVTNCRTTIFYNAKNGKEIKLNENPIREFQTIDILRLIKNKLKKEPDIDNILTNVDSSSVISEAIFNKKLWELAKIYRNINFENNIQKIDFTIGFISLEYFEEKEKSQGTRDNTKIYWSECSDGTDTYPAERVVGFLAQYINRLEKESQFGEFADLMEKVRIAITGKKTDKPLVGKEEVKQIYNVIDSMKPLHGTGFDLFGAVYEMFASSKEKKEFGEYFTRRHYTHILAKLLLQDEKFFNPNWRFGFLDLACGTGGFLTEGFKVLKTEYSKTNTFTEDAKKFLEEECFWGIDVRKENISRTKLNMFLVGDGHTNMVDDNTLTRNFKGKKWNYIITNPPYGAGTIRAETSEVSSNRTEVAFLCKVIKLLEDGGRACIILPDGVLENPSLAKLRKELLEKCEVYAIISLPKFAFAPYTKEKTYAVYFRKKNQTITRIQKTPIWMYIVDNDGLANSDKRFPTKLRNNRNGWMHDEISGWVSTNGEEMPGLLEERWLDFDDSDTDGSEWINEKGQKMKLRKGGYIYISKIISSNYYYLLPEYYLRPFAPNYVSMEQFGQEIGLLRKEIEQLTLSEATNGNESCQNYESYQGKDIPINELLDCMSGNPGLTENEIYQKIQIKGPRYIVLSSSTQEDTLLGEIPQCYINGKPLKTFEDKEGILVIRNGIAGKTFLLNAGKYTINDHAYILSVKEKCQYEISLKWLMIQYGKVFLEYSSSSDNGTWNKTGFFQDVKIDLPSYAEQIRVVKIYAELDNFDLKIKAINKKIENMLCKQLIAG